MSAAPRLARTGRLALRQTRVLRESGVSAGAAPNSGVEGAEEAKKVKQTVLQKGAKKDPELYTLAIIMTGAFSLAGFYFARKPTSSSSEQTVAMAPNSKPWESGTSGKYQYHPGGDRTSAPRDAPSALHSVVVPNVNLPKHLHEQFNKYDKDEFEDY